MVPFFRQSAFTQTEKVKKILGTQQTRNGSLSHGNVKKWREKQSHAVTLAVHISRGAKSLYCESKVSCPRIQLTDPVGVKFWISRPRNKRVTHKATAPATTRWICV